MRACPAVTATLSAPRRLWTSPTLPKDGTSMVFSRIPPPRCTHCGYPLVWSHALQQWVGVDIGPTDCARDPEGIYHRPPDGVVPPPQRTEGVRLSARQFA